MTKQQWKERLPVIQAWINNKAIQYIVKEEPWTDYTGDCPNFSYGPVEWRIKPEPREFWVNVYRTGYTIYKTEEEAHREADKEKRRACIHVKEVV